MQLTTLLMIAVGILTFLSGVAVLAGTAKEKRMEGVWYFVLTLGTAVWEVAIGIFMAPSPTSTIAPIVITLLYSGATFMLSGFVGYTGWRYKIGKVFTIVSLLGAVVLSALVAIKPELLYPEIILSHSGNYITPTLGAFYNSYIAYCVVTALAIFAFALYSLGRSRNHNERAGLTILLVGTGIASVFTMIFDLFLPLVRYDLIWIGPLATSVNILCFYYETLKYRLIPLSTNWLRIITYIILTVVSAIIYMVIFFIVFTALFHGASPSSSIVILNFVMILIFVLFTPTYNEITGSIRSQISTSTIDLTYVVKKLTSMSGSNVNLNELAGFLADHLHFQYIGILFNNHLYGSKNTVLTADAIDAIHHLKEPEYGIWTHLNADARKALNDTGIKGVAEIRDEHGRRIGQVLFGRPMGKVSFEHRQDLNQVEMVIGLVEDILNSHKKR